MERQIVREIGHYEYLFERLVAAFPDADEDTLRDTLEGLSNLPEMIGAVVRSELEDRALAKGLKGRIAEMGERLGRFEERADKKRDTAREAMVSADIRKITEPDFTVNRVSSDAHALDRSCEPENAIHSMHS